jgi:hypothetical protein
MDSTASIVAVLLSALGAIVTAAISFLLVIFICARFVNGEKSYGLTVIVGLPVATIASIAAFVMIFRKIRSLAT